MRYILPFLSLIVFVLPAYSKVELPEIPQRPSLKELSKSLSTALNVGKVTKKESKNKNMKHINEKNNTKK